MKRKNQNIQDASDSSTWAWYSGERPASRDIISIAEAAEEDTEGPEILYDNTYKKGAFSEVIVRISELMIDKKGELLKAHKDFQLVISYNPGYQSLMKDLKQSTKQRFIAFDFDFANPEIETIIVSKESGVDSKIAEKLVQFANTTRKLVGHGLDEGASTRLLNYAGILINSGVDIKDACQIALIKPITDDSEVRDAMNASIEAIFG